VTDGNNITKSNESQAEAINIVDIIHFSGLSPERYYGLDEERKAEWERAFRASGASSGVHELAQGRRRK